MRLPTTFAILTALSVTAIAAPTWQTISSEPGKKIELDRTSIKREGDTVTALGRVVLDKEIIDTRSGAGFKVIEATTRYDCLSRNSNTIKRTYKRNESDIVRSEDLKSPQLPVRAGTLDDKVLREVCRPKKDDTLNEVARKANEAAAQLKAANEALMKKQLASASKAEAVKVSDKLPAMIPSIRPNLKAEAEAAKLQAGSGASQVPATPATPPPTPAKPAAPATPPPVASPPSPPPPPKAAPTYKQTTVTVRSTTPAPKPRKTPAAENYMLELAPAPTPVATAEPVAVVKKSPVVWSYDGEGGPEHWASIDPKNALCGQGQRQSPIDIRDGIRVDLEPIAFHYRPSYFRVQDTGRTIQVRVGDNAMSLGGKTYELSHIEFHRPSEEKINGQRFDMSAHLVHKADDGQIAIIAILLERGAENPFIQTIWNNLPLERHLTVNPHDTPIDLTTLLPALRNYYTYMGSMTTPPCSEGVLWLVMKHSVPVSQEQINIFARFYPNNARPTQALAGRTIKEDR